MYRFFQLFEMKLVAGEYERQPGDCTAR